jgi:DNA-binding transcriptional LysR family regulator
VSDLELAPLLARFQEKYPDIKLTLELTDSYLNLVEAGIDLAIRIEDPDDSSLIARKLGVNQLVACASPEYLKKAPMLKTASDLKKHPFLFLGHHKDIRFLKSGLTISLEAAGDIFLVVPSRRHLSPRVRELMNFIISNYK